MLALQAKNKHTMHNAHPSPVLFIVCTTLATDYSHAMESITWSGLSCSGLSVDNHWIGPRILATLLRSMVILYLAVAVAHRDTLAQKGVSIQYPNSLRLMTSQGDWHPQLMLPTGEGGGLPSRVQRFLNLDDIYPSLATCWPIHILISVFEFFCNVLTAEFTI